MAEYIVELPELEVACDFFIDAEYPYFEELREAFLILKLCGCRPMEIFEISRWTYINDWNFSLQPQKNNLVRSVTLGTGCESFRTCVINQTSPFLGRTYSQIQGLFYRLCPWRPIFSGEREITLYVYRYLFVKSLIAGGLTYSQVAELMGHRTETPVYLYANAILTSTYEIPVTPTDPLPEGHIDIFTTPKAFGTLSDILTLDFPFSSKQFCYIFRISDPEIGTSTLFSSNDYITNQLYPRFIYYKTSSLRSIQSRLYEGYNTFWRGLSLSTAHTFPVFIVMMLDYTEEDPDNPANYLYKFRYYINNSLSSTNIQKYIKNLKPYPSSMVVGARKSGLNTYTDFFKGTVDFLYFYERWLTLEEIQQIENL